MTIQAYKLGSLGQDSVVGTKIMTAYLAANGANQYMTFEYPVGTDYVVTAGYTFYITKIDISGNALPPNACQALIGYGDDGVADGGDAPTNFVRLTGAYEKQAAISTLSIDVLIPIPAGKYPCINCIPASVTMVTAYGIEIAD